MLFLCLVGHLLEDHNQTLLLVEVLFVIAGMLNSHFAWCNWIYIFNNGVSRWLFLCMCVQQWSSFMTLVSNYNIHICCNPLLCLSLDKRRYKLDSGHVWLCWMVLILPDLKVSNWSSLLFSVTERRSSLHHHHCFTSSPTHDHFTNTKLSLMTFSSQFHSPFCIPSISIHDDHILQISFVILS
jgi:hypothetical protein